MHAFSFILDPSDPACREARRFDQHGFWRLEPFIRMQRSRLAQMSDRRVEGWKTLRHLNMQIEGREESRSGSARHGNAEGRFPVCGGGKSDDLEAAAAGLHRAGNIPP